MVSPWYLYLKYIVTQNKLRTCERKQIFFIFATAVDPFLVGCYHLLQVPLVSRTNSAIRILKINFFSNIYENFFIAIPYAKLIPLILQHAFKML